MCRFEVHKPFGFILPGLHELFGFPIETVRWTSLPLSWAPRIATMPSQREQVIEQAHERIARIRSDLNAMDYFIFWDASAAYEKSAAIRVVAVHKDQRGVMARTISGGT